MKALVLLSAAGGGDRQPVVSLAVALDQSGHDVMFLCDAATAKLVEGARIRTAIHDVDQVGYISRWISRLSENESPLNPLVEWGAKTVPETLTPARDFAPDVIVSSLFCMGLAVSLIEGI